MKGKLDKMERQSVIKKIDQPTDWIHNLVIVKKKDKCLRLCLDPRELSVAIKREHFQLPTLDEGTS